MFIKIISKYFNIYRLINIFYKICNILKIFNGIFMNYYVEYFHIDRRGDYYIFYYIPTHIHSASLMYFILIIIILWLLIIKIKHWNL